jgi:hypothetical protein
MVVGRLAAGVAVIAMLAKRARMGETFQAAVALEGPLASVEPHVLREMVLVLEGLVADGARVGALVCNENKE